MPKVSVVIPAYNREKFLEDAIDSILKQSFQDFEIIVVDDGSIDNTKTLVSGFQARDSRIVYICQENQGVSAARNAGCKAAQGTYIAFLDSDDRMLPHRLAKQVKILDENKDIGLVYGSVLIREIHKPELEKFGIVFQGAIPCREMFLNLLKYHIFFNLSTVTMRRDIFRRHKFDTRMKIGEDFLFCLQASRDHLFYGIDEPLAIRITGHDSMITGRFRKRFDEKVALGILLHDTHGKIRMGYLLYMQSVSNLYLYYAKDYWMKERHFKYFVYLLKSFLYFPFNMYIYKHLIKQKFKGLLLGFLPRSILINFKKDYYARSLTKFDERNEPDFEMVKYAVESGDTVIDIGANAGWYTKFLSNLAGESGKVISIEPAPETFAVLSHCVKKLKLNNVQVFNCAISDKEGVCDMEVPQYSFGGLNFYQTKITDNKARNPLSRYFSIMARPLDSFMPHLEKGVSFIKCDVEGHELSVIRSASRIISRFKPVWLIEVSSDPDSADSPAAELFRIMQENGYSAYWYGNRRLHQRAKSDKSTNYFFITPEKFKQLQIRGCQI